MTSGRHQGLAGPDSRNLAAPIRQILAGITAHSVGIPIVCVLTQPGSRTALPVTRGRGWFTPESGPSGRQLWRPRRAIGLNRSRGRVLRQVAVAEGNVLS